MSEFYYRHIAPIICRIVGHKWDGFGRFFGDCEIGVHDLIMAERAENGDLRYIGKEVNILLNIVVDVVV